MNKQETLDSLSAGSQAAVLEVHGRGRAELRLQELGFVPGVALEVICCDEPMLVRVGEQRLSIRHASAKSISVYPLN